MMQTRIFKKSSIINAPVDEVFKWHARPGAIQRLSPPWDPLTVNSQFNGIQKGAEVRMTLKAGPIPFNWTAKHIEYIENHLFKDMQIRGPFSTWVHTHRFEQKGSDACLLEDQVEYALPFHPVSTSIADSFIRQKLERIFEYRHLTTVEDLSRHQHACFGRPLKILISGASGLIGSSLVPFLTTGGHHVLRLVRKPPKNENEIYWDPRSGSIHLDKVGELDAVIHLAGENIGEGWWSDEKKRIIIESRVNGTAAVAQAISKLKNPPSVFLSASAIGYYGNRGSQKLTEFDASGNDFISEVCRKWEEAASPAADSGIRTVFLRIGIVLTPGGGALAKLLPPFQFGVGGKIATGKQYMSWISIDDVVYAIYHALSQSSMEGPVNIVAPAPVTNAEFSKMLGAVLSRPVFFKVPQKAIELVFGEMGIETILSSTRVAPDRLEQSGYHFRHPDLESALRHVLGKYQ